MWLASTLASFNITACRLVVNVFVGIRYTIIEMKRSKKTELHELFTKFSRNSECLIPANGSAPTTSQTSEEDAVLLLINSENIPNDFRLTVIAQNCRMLTYYDS